MRGITPRYSIFGIVERLHIYLNLIETLYNNVFLKYIIIFYSYPCLLSIKQVYPDFFLFILTHDMLYPKCVEVFLHQRNGKKMVYENLRRGICLFSVYKHLKQEANVR